MWETHNLAAFNVAVAAVVRGVQSDLHGITLQLQYCQLGT